MSDLVEYDLVYDFVRNLGLRTLPDKKLRSMLQSPTSGLAAQISDRLASPSSSSSRPVTRELAMIKLQAFVAREGNL